MIPRYSRHEDLFGEEGQVKLKEATVGVAGVGGLGVNVTTALACAGVGTLILADSDSPEESNLNRQYIYNDSEGRTKSEISLDWVYNVNPEVEAVSYNLRIDENSVSVFKDCDVIMDCLDNIESRLILNKFAVENNIPLIHGGVEGMVGQVTVVIPGKTPCLECFLRSGMNGTKASLGAAVGFIGNAQAAEAIKLITGKGEVLAGKIFSADLEKGNFVVVDIAKNPECECCKNL